jgi:hypothetical protein
VRPDLVAGGRGEVERGQIGVRLRSRDDATLVFAVERLDVGHRIDARRALPHPCGGLCDAARAGHPARRESGAAGLQEVPPTRERRNINGSIGGHDYCTSTRVLTLTLSESNR